MDKLHHTRKAANRPKHDGPRSRCTVCGIRSTLLTTYAHTGPLYVRTGSRCTQLPGIELVARGEALCSRCLAARRSAAAGKGNAR